GIGDDGIARAGLAIVCRALQHESENAARKSGATRSAPLAAQLLRLPDGAAAATSAKPSQSAPAPSRHGCGCRRCRQGPERLLTSNRLPVSSGQRRLTPLIHTWPQSRTDSDAPRASLRSKPL